MDCKEKAVGFSGFSGLSVGSQLAPSACHFNVCVFSFIHRVGGAQLVSGYLLEKLLCVYIHSMHPKTKRAQKTPMLLSWSTPPLE